MKMMCIKFAAVALSCIIVEIVVFGNIENCSRHTAPGFYVELTSV
jgi:hypothetical protein